MSVLRRIFRQIGIFKHIDVSELPLDFDGQAYLDLNPDLAKNNINPFSHYLQQGRVEARQYKKGSPSEKKPVVPILPPDFEPEEYRNLHPDLEHHKGSLESHFLQYGFFELRRYKDSVRPIIPALERYARLPKDFDPDIYLELNPDIANPTITPHNHYVDIGIHEGRQYRFPNVIASIGKPVESNKPTILLVSHEATRTGAPILTWNILQQLKESYNTVVLLLGEGALLANFQFDANETYLIPSIKHNQKTAHHVISELSQRHHLKFAILNSIETGTLCRPLTLAGIPSTLLIHEFAANTMPREKFLESQAWASVAIFSTRLTKEDAVRCFPGGLFEDALVLPQGRCRIPQTLDLPSSLSFQAGGEATNAREILPSTRKLVVGIGSVCLRKGVDLFIEVASQMKAQAGEEAFDFLWVGSGYPDYDPEYSAFLTDHIQRAGLTANIRIVPDTDDLESLYDRASLLLLTSRLDPLPNIAIDAICKGLPLVCFDKASGIADVLKGNNLEVDCVAAYINTSDMANKAIRLLDAQIHDRIRKAFQTIGKTDFSMPGYCGQLTAQQDNAKHVLEQCTVNVAALIKTGCFDVAYYRGRKPPARHLRKIEEESYWEYVLHTRANTVIRKPAVGFNPLVYRERTNLERRIDPLLHHIHNPDDSKHVLPELITPSKELPTAIDHGKTVALHIHAYYPDMLGDILDRLKPNRSSVTLFITVDSIEKQTDVQTLLDKKALKQASVIVYTNKGRDVYPFLELCKSIGDQFDIIGHIHTKKSPHVTDGSDLVVRWRDLLLGNLLGSEHCEDMLDRIICHMDRHPAVQLVFPDDPHVIGWGKNLRFAEMLCTDSEFAQLPKHFEFPVGTMFWATSAYLDAFVKMELTERFTPKEPLPIDGTILHAWERLLGAKVGSQPPGYALTFVPGLSR